jgi:type III pantothenate kinase
MILLVDAGNSRLKWAFLRNGRFESGGSLERKGKQTAALARKAWGSLDTPPARVLVASVAGPAFRRSLTSWAAKHWQVTPEFLIAQAHAFEVRNAYEEPLRLGVDRWAALVAARALGAVPTCIVDCGTAIVIDALAADGRHLGGLITPGLGLMRESLIQRAEEIREERVTTSSSESSLLASDTGNAIIGGCLYAAVAMIDRVVLDLSGELGKGLRTVITGGDAPRIKPLLASRVRYEPDLVLRGVAVMAGRRESVGESGRGQEVL